MQNRAVPKLTATSLLLQDRNSKRKRRDPSTHDKRHKSCTEVQTPKRVACLPCCSRYLSRQLRGGASVLSPKRPSLQRFRSQSSHLGMPTKSTHKTNKFQGSVVNPGSRKTQFHFSRSFFNDLFEQETFEKPSIMSNPVNAIWVRQMAPLHTAAAMEVASKVCATVSTYTMESERLIPSDSFFRRSNAINAST